MNAQELLDLPELEAPTFHIRHLADGRVVKIPIMPQILASYWRPDDVIMTADADGVWWKAVNTREGYRKMRT